MLGPIDPAAVPADLSLAERKRMLVRDELAEAALKLLAWQGYEATTIDQIAAAAGVSRRTFFRYFTSKEDVVVQFLEHVGAHLRGRLAVRPEAEPPAVALRQALEIFVDACREYPEKALRLTRLMLGTPALLGRFLERQEQWRADLAAELARRAGRAPDRDLRPALAAAVALAAFDTALQHWTAGNGENDLAKLIDEAFSVVATALNAAENPSEPQP
jgi:AcrR family transcriptional regulator